MSKAISPAKLKAVEEVKELCEQHDVIGFVRMQKIGAKQITDLRAKLRGTAILKMAKKAVISRAFADVKGKAGLPQILEAYDAKIGPSALIFTNRGAIGLRRLLDSNKTSTRAKAGDVIDKEIVVSEGDTKIPPGPVISELNQAGLPTRIQNGTIWITKNTTILKPGDKVDFKMSMVLGRLEIEPVDIVLDLYIAYQDGEVLGRDILMMDVSKYEDMVQTAYANALKLSIELGIVTPENAKRVVMRAYSKARALALELPIIIPSLLRDYLIKAQTQALVLNAAAKGESLAAPSGPGPSPSPEPEPEPEPEKEEEEDVGLGNLFG